MRRIACLLACMCVLLVAHAQNSPAAKACVAEVRKMYQEAKEMMAESDKHEEMQNDMVVTISSMEAAIGRQVTTYHYYFLNDYEEKLSTYVSRPYFVTRSFNVAPRKYYEEYMYDFATATLRFAFMQWEDISGKVVEERYYFDKNDRLVWHMLKNIDEARPAEDIKHASDNNLNAFYSLKR